jgi:hypothetical protein
MSDALKSSDTDKRLARPDFDLVEDIGDTASFNRALDELLPKGELSLGGRCDIDPDDFEAFNRELDAQMAKAKARAGRRDDIVEDLGTDVVDRRTAAAPMTTAPAPENAAGPAGEPAVADDVVTLGTIAAAIAAPPAVTAAAPLPAKDAVAPAAAGPGAAPARSGRGAGVAAIALGLAGLVAGATALWLDLERQAELTRLRAALGERQVVANSPAPADTERVRELEQRLEEVNRRLAALSAAAPDPGSNARSSSVEPPADHEPAAAAPAPAITHNGKAAIHVGPTPSRAETKTAVKESAAAAHPSPPATTPAAPAPPVSPMDSGVAEATPAAAPAQALPKPSGTGLWAVVIDSYADESVAEQRRAQVQRMGVPAEVRWSLVKEQVRYRVVVPGYATQDAANDAAAELRRRKAGGAWVMRLPKQ